MKKYCIMALFIVISANSYASMDLIKSKNCLACHAQDKKLVGPSFTDIKAKYEKSPEAEDKLTQRVINGSGGAWGPVPMPKNNQVSEEEAKQLVKWILNK